MYSTALDLTEACLRVGKFLLPTGRNWSDAVLNDQMTHYILDHDPFSGRQVKPIERLRSSIRRRPSVDVDVTVGVPKLSLGLANVLITKDPRSRIGCALKSIRVLQSGQIALLATKA